MSCLSIGLDQGGAELCNCSGDVSSWGSQAGCGRDRGLEWCLLGIRGSRNPSSGIPADHGCPQPGCSAFTAALLYCWGGGKKPDCDFFSFFIIFNRPTHSLL